MAAEILNIPPSEKGVIVEAGCFKGGTSATLSIVACYVNREFHIFDSFEGLPDPEGEDSEHVFLNEKRKANYNQGDWEGSLAEVKSNIERCGKLDVCYFHDGFFDETMPNFDKKCVFVFEDADLRSSVEDVISGLWPNMTENARFYTHEANHLSISSLFFEEEFWTEQFETSSPGLVGAGHGLGLYPSKSGFSSSLGYTSKQLGSRDDEY